MRIVNCKLQIEESAIYNFQFTIFNLQFWLALCIAMVVAIPAPGAEPRLLPQKLLDQGWISLFDAETLFGWQATGDAKWEVAGGEIRTKGEKPGFLMTTTEWADYQLHVEFKAQASTNSGVFLRTPMRPTDPAK